MACGGILGVMNARRTYTVEHIQKDQTHLGQTAKLTRTSATLRNGLILLGAA